VDQKHPRDDPMSTPTRLRLSAQNERLLAFDRQLIEALLFPTIGRELAFVASHTVHH
jgi:hypothetical protein